MGVGVGGPRFKIETPLTQSGYNFTKYKVDSSYFAKVVLLFYIGDVAFPIVVFRVYLSAIGSEKNPRTRTWRPEISMRCSIKINESPNA